MLNSKQLAINDEQNFVSFVANSCKRKVIFALNKLDSFNPEDGDSIEDAIISARQMTEECGIKNPTIVPISGIGALIIRQQAQPYSTLTDSDRHTLHWIRQLAEIGYLNLPRYAGADTGINNGGELLWITGVPLLEKAIIDNLQ